MPVLYNLAQNPSLIPIRKLPTWTLRIGGGFTKCGGVCFEFSVGVRIYFSHFIYHAVGITKPIMNY